MLRPAAGFWKAAFALLAVVGLALVLRHLFVTGVVFFDDLGYSQAAYDLLSGRFRLQPWPGGQARVGLYAPVTLSYAIFGVSPWSTLLFPLVSSLASVIVVYAIGRLLADEAAGLIGAFIWAVMPLDVQMAGALLPDGPLATLGAVAIWFFLRADLRRPQRSTAGFLGAGLCLAFALLVKPLALVAVPFAVVYLIVDRRIRAGTLVSLLALLAAGVVAYTYYYSVGAAPTVTEGQALPPVLTRVAATATDWLHRLLTEPAFAAFTPVAAVATVALLGRPNGRSWVALLWAGCSFLLFELGSISLREYMPIPPTWRASQVLPVLLPFAVVSGVHLTRLVSASAARWIVAIASAAVVLMAMAASRAAQLSGAAISGSPVPLPLATASGIGLGAVVLGAVASPWLIRRAGPVVRGPALGGLLIAVGVVSVHVTQTAMAERHEAWYTNLDPVVRFLKSHPRDVIYAQNRVASARLNVASGFTLGFDYFAPEAPVGRLRLASSDLGSLTGSALIVIDDEMVRWSEAAGLGAPPASFRTPPAHWALVLTAGTAEGHRTRVYRFSPADAQKEFDDARQAALASPDTGSLARLVGAAAAARDFCAAAGAWLRLRASSPAAAEPFEPVGLLKGCLAQNPGVAGPNLLRNGDLASGTDGWWAAADAKADRSVESESGTGSRFMRVEYRGGNWAVMSQQATLEPDAAYVYSMRVRTTAPVVSLYWQADVGHSLEENHVYEAWTTLVHVFVTPRWDGRPVAATFSPILMMGAGEARVADVRLARLTIGERGR